MIISPLFIKIGKKKHYINLNNYRNLHYQVSNKLKKEYKYLLFPQLYNKKFNGPLKIEMTLFRGDNRRADLDNILSIHCKFLLDALTEYKCIKDDNTQVIKEIVFKYGGIQKGNGRVETIIKKIED